MIKPRCSTHLQGQPGDHSTGDGGDSIADSNNRSLRPQCTHHQLQHHQAHKERSGLKTENGSSAELEEELKIHSSSEYLFWIWSVKAHRAFMFCEPFCLFPYEAEAVGLNPQHTGRQIIYSFLVLEIKNITITETIKVKLT